jgi:hypothetical protein
VFELWNNSVSVQHLLSHTLLTKSAQLGLLDPVSIPFTYQDHQLGFGFLLFELT